MVATASIQNDGGTISRKKQKREPMVLGYCRVSTQEQARHGVSLDTQSERIKAWCDFQQRGTPLIVRELGVSGGSLQNRHQLRVALGMLERGDTLVVCALSRLVRSIRDALDIVKLLEQRGASLVSLSEELNTETAAGRFLFHLLASLAELERGQISERTSACVRHLFQSGGYIGGRRPFGFNLVEVGGKTRLTLNAQEWNVIEEARRLRSGGLSLRKIAETLRQQGHCRQSGGPYYPALVASMMRPKPSLEAREPEILDCQAT